MRWGIPLRFLAGASVSGLVCSAWFLLLIWLTGDGVLFVPVHAVLIACEILILRRWTQERRRPIATGPEQRPSPGDGPRSLPR